MEIKQLYKKIRGIEGNVTGKLEVAPVTYIQSIIDEESGLGLDQILALMNHVYVPFTGDAIETYQKLRTSFRRRGTIVTYRDANNALVTRQYNGASFNDSEWAKLSNWEVYMPAWWGTGGSGDSCDCGNIAGTIVPLEYVVNLNNLENWEDDDADISYGATIHSYADAINTSYKFLRDYKSIGLTKRSELIKDKNNLSLTLKASHFRGEYLEVGVSLGIEGYEASRKPTFKFHLYNASGNVLSEGDLNITPSSETAPIRFPWNGLVRLGVALPENDNLPFSYNELENTNVLERFNSTDYVAKVVIDINFPTYLPKPSISNIDSAYLEFTETEELTQWLKEAANTLVGGTGASDATTNSVQELLFPCIWEAPTKEVVARFASADYSRKSTKYSPEGKTWAEFTYLTPESSIIDLQNKGAIKEYNILVDPTNTHDAVGIPLPSVLDKFLNLFSRVVIRRGQYNSREGYGPDGNLIKVGWVEGHYTDYSIELGSRNNSFKGEYRDIDFTEELHVSMDGGSTWEHMQKK